MFSGNKQKLGSCVTAMPYVCVPPRHIDPHDTKHLVKGLAGVKDVDLVRLTGNNKIIDNTKVAKRHISTNVDQVIANGHMSAEVGAKLYQKTGAALFRQAALGALEAAHCKPEDIDCIVSVSCTNATLPALSAQFLEELGFKNSVEHLPVSQWGCAGGVAALKWAARFLQAAPTCNALVLCCEVNSSMFHSNPDRGSLICASLFGDAAGGVVIYGSESPLLKSGPKRKGYELNTATEYILPDTTHWMFYETDSKGQHFRLSQDVRDSMDQAYPQMKEYLEEIGQSIEDPNFSIVAHTGGPQILRHLLGLLYPEADGKTVQRSEDPRLNFAQEHLGSPEEVWRTRGSFDVLRNFGNVASVTIMAGLRNQLLDVENGAIPEGNIIILGCGPGMSVQIAHGSACDLGDDSAKAELKPVGIAQIVPKVSSNMDSMSMWPQLFPAGAAESTFDYAILNSSPEELLLASMLSRQGKKVALVSENEWNLNYDNVTPSTDSFQSKDKIQKQDSVHSGKLEGLMRDVLTSSDDIAVVFGYKLLGVDKVSSEKSRIRLYFNETDTDHELVAKSVIKSAEEFDLKERDAAEFKTWLEQSLNDKVEGAEEAVNLYTGNMKKTVSIMD